MGDAKTSALESSGVHLLAPLIFAAGLAVGVPIQAGWSFPMMTLAGVVRVLSWIVVALAFLPVIFAALPHIRRIAQRAGRGARQRVASQ